MTAADPRPPTPDPITQLRWRFDQAEAREHELLLGVVRRQGSLLGRMAVAWDRLLGRHPAIGRLTARPGRLLVRVGMGRVPRSLGRNPLFDAEWYRSQHLDVREGRMDAYRHYRRHGWREHRDPNPWFSVERYLRLNDDVRAAGVDPLDHFHEMGWRELRDPCEGFSTAWYLEANPDVVLSGMDPLLHFLRHGLAEGRPPQRPPYPVIPRGLVQAAGPSTRAVRQVPTATSEEAARLRAWRVRRDPHRYARRYLDAAWYLAALPEPPPAGSDPYDHYRTVGVALGIGPNAVFDVETYRYDHPDVADHGDDPLLHWVLVGRERGATPHPLFDPAWYRMAHPGVGADPYLHYLVHGRAAGLAPCAALAPGEDPAAGYPIALPRTDPETVTIVIPAYRNAAMTLRCLAAVARRTPASLGVRVLLADDDPTRPLGPLLAARVEGLDVRANPVNLGFLRNCNGAADDARGEHLVLLNNDTVVGEGWLEALLAPVTDDPTVGMVGARLLNLDGTLQEAGVIMYRDGWGVPHGRDDDPERPGYRFPRRVDAVTGACFLVRRDAFEAVGRFNDDLAPAFFEEYDLAYALRARGLDTVYAPACRVIHAGSATYGSETRDRQSTRNHATFVARWADLLATAHEGPADELLARERPRRGGVVLVIDDRVPEHDRHAGSLFVRQQLDLLVEADCRVIYVPFDGVLRQPHAAAMEALGMEVLAPGVDLEAWLEEHGRHVDRVLVARPHIAERWLPSIRRRCPRARVAYFTHDLHHLREQRRHATTGEPGALAEARRLEVQETAVLRAVDAILTPSEAELAPIAAIAPGVPAWALPPYAVDVPPVGPPLAERRAVMFLGGYEHLPNVDAALLLATDIMPRVWARAPDAVLLLVGADPPPEVRALAGPRVEVTGFVPDLAPCYARARLTLSPLRYGAGLKGKIVSSLEAGVPVVTTPVGDEGLGLRPGVEGLIADTPAGLAAHAVTLLADADLATAMAAAGRAWVLGRLGRERARTTLHAALDLPLPAGVTR